jgi:hypothetical protein
VGFSLPARGCAGVLPSCPRRGGTEGDGVVGEASMLGAGADPTRCSAAGPGEERSEGWWESEGKGRRIGPLLPEGAVGFSPPARGGVAQRSGGGGGSSALSTPHSSPLTPHPSQGQVIVAVDPRYFRPAEVDSLLGDASKARKKLGWRPKVKFSELVSEMVQQDLKLAQKDELVKRHGHRVLDRKE